ncbi:unnamed protein product [Ophioblennius macclurei]
MTELESCMASLINVFETYAGEDGNSETLSKKECKKLLTVQLPGLIKGAKCPEEVDKMLNGLDFDGDNEVDFLEFSIMVVSLCAMCRGMKPKS